VAAAVAQRQIQLDQLVGQAAQNGSSVNVDQIANLQIEINELDALTRRQESLRDALSARNSPSTGGGSGGVSPQESFSTSLERRLRDIQVANVELLALRDGYAQSASMAEVFAEAAMLGGGAIDAQTQSMIRQLEIAAVLNEELRQLAEDPVRKWMDSVPTWIEGAQQIEVNAIQGLRDSLSDFLYEGEADLQGFVDMLRRSMADILSDQITGQLLNAFGRADPGADGLAGLGGGPGAMQGAMINGGQTAAAMIQAAMVSGMGEALPRMESLFARGGQTLSNSMSTAGSIAGNSIRMSTTASGMQHARAVGTAIEAGGTSHASKVQAAAAGGGIGGGGGGFGGTLMSLIPSVLGMFFEEGGYATSPVKTSAVPMSAFVGAPKYAEGTSNTSGIPAILHPNEAVIPLSRNRKIPVEMGAGGGGSGAPVITNNVSVTVDGGGSNDDESLAATIGEQVANNMRAMIQYEITEQARYGGSLNQRGGGY
jgi:hypothetical protein